MKVKSLLVATAALLSVGTLHAQSNEGFKVHCLGANHSLVKVLQPKKYMLLPVEEGAPEATVRILIKNEAVQTFQVRLAMNHIDYYMPFDLQAYQGESVVMDVHTGTSRANLQDALDDVCWKGLQLSETYDTANREEFRPLYHHTPLYGWMNDPNGMFYKDGEYHLYYQYNPYGSMWGNMTWAHSSSKDLIHWNHHPLAIRPNALGAVFSGSSVIDKNNVAGFGKDAVIAIYTSAGASQIQSLAYSTDHGQTFTTYSGNPIITADRESRDPNMFWHEESGKWVLILAAALDREMWIYTSSDLKNWTKESSFGKGWGAQEGVWECPDLMKLPVRGTKESKWVLICNLNPGGPFGGSAAQYFVGDFDGKKFTCESKPELTKWLDYGKDHYAAVSWSNAPDNRHTVIAWMSNWQYATQVPTMQYRSANSLPRDLELYKGKDGEYYVAVIPSPELEALRGVDALKFKNILVTDKTASYPLPEANQGACEIVMDLAVRSAEKVFITLSNHHGEEVMMTYNKKDKTFSMDRTKSGLTDFSKDFPAVTVAPLVEGNKHQLRLFIDRCSIEAFEGKGYFAMTNLVFPKHPYTSITLSTDKGVGKVSEMTIYPIEVK